VEWQCIDLNGIQKEVSQIGDHDVKTFSGLDDGEKRVSAQYTPGCVKCQEQKKVSVQLTVAECRLF
jgi:hypothetical protein